MYKRQHSLLLSGLEHFELSVLGRAGFGREGVLLSLTWVQSPVLFVSNIPHQAAYLVQFLLPFGQRISAQPCELDAGFCGNGDGGCVADSGFQHLSGPQAETTPDSQSTTAWHGDRVIRDLVGVRNRHAVCD